MHVFYEHRALMKSYFSFIRLSMHGDGEPLILKLVTSMCRRNAQDTDHDNEEEACRPHDDDVVTCNFVMYADIYLLLLYCKHDS